MPHWYVCSALGVCRVSRHDEFSVSCELSFDVVFVHALWVVVLWCSIGGCCWLAILVVRGVGVVSSGLYQLCQASMEWILHCLWLYSR